MWILLFAVDRLRMAVDLVDHLPPHIDVPLIATEQQSIAETRDTKVVGIATGEAASLWYGDSEGPTITAAIPLAVAKQDSAPSTSAIRSSNIVTVGLP